MGNRSSNSNSDGDGDGGGEKVEIIFYMCHDETKRLEFSIGRQRCDDDESTLNNNGNE